MRSIMSHQLLAPALVLALAAATPVSARAGAVIDGFIINPTPLAFVILSTAPTTPGPVTLSWVDRASGETVRRNCQHPFDHVIEPYSAIQASLGAARPGESSLFKFNLVANTGQVKCGLIQHGARGDDKGAALAQLAFTQSSLMARNLAPNVVELTQEQGVRENQAPVWPNLKGADFRGCNLQNFTHFTNETGGPVVLHFDGHSITVNQSLSGHPGVEVPSGWTLTQVTPR